MVGGIPEEDSTDHGDLLTTENRLSDRFMRLRWAGLIIRGTVNLLWGFAQPCWRVARQNSMPAPASWRAQIQIERWLRFSSSCRPC